MRELIEGLKATGIRHPKVLKAMQAVDRLQFVDKSMQAFAQLNESLPIACEQTISQPYIVAAMTQAILRETAPGKVLEIGTGSGYQAAILAEIFEQVHTIERIDTLYHLAKSRFQRLGYDNIHCYLADGADGLAECAPFDAIMVTAATAQVPPALLNQLSPDGGRLVLPVGTTDQAQMLTLIHRHGDEYEQRILESVLFVPLLSGLRRNDSND